MEELVQFKLWNKRITSNNISNISHLFSVQIDGYVGFQLLKEIGQYMVARKLLMWMGICATRFMKLNIWI